METRLAANATVSAPRTRYLAPTIRGDARQELVEPQCERVVGHRT